MKYREKSAPGPRRICFLMRSDSREVHAGAEIQAGNLASALAGIGWEVHYICRKASGREGTECRNGVTYHYVGKKRRMFEWIDFPGIYGKLMSLEPDITYQRMLSPDTALLGWMSVHRKIPFIWNCTDNRSLNRRFFQKRVGWRKINGPLPVKFTRWIILRINAHINDLLAGWGLNRADARIVQNDVQKSQARERFGEEPYVMPSGHPVPEEGISGGDGRPRVVWAGNLGARKRPELLLKLADMCRDLDVVFEVFGQGSTPDGWAVAGELARRANINYHGYRPPDEVNEALDRSDFLLNTSSWEGFPNTFIQAWLRGIPVLSLGVNPDSILDDMTYGRSFSSVEAAFEFISREIRQPYYGRSRRDRIRALARERYDIAQVARRYDELLSRFTRYREIPEGEVHGNADPGRGHDKCRVLHVLRSARYGGIETQVLNLATLQAGERYDGVGVLFARGEGELIELFRSSGAACYFADLRGACDISPRKAVKIINIFKRYDILHLHSFIPVLCLCAAASRRKIVYTIHGGFSPAAEMTVIKRIKKAMLKYYLNKWADHVTFNSRFTRQAAEAAYGLSGVRRDVVYNGTAARERVEQDSSEEEAQRREIGGRFVVGTASHFIRIKRIDLLIRAFARFSNGRNTVLMLVGDGPLEPDLKRLCESLGISGATIFTGPKSDAVICQRLMDVCVFPSGFESFGLAAMETLSLGKPTIIFGDSCGMLETAGAFLADDVVNDIEQLAGRLEHYYENREEIERDAGRRMEYSKEFSLDKAAAGYGEIYDLLLGKKEETG